MWRCGRHARRCDWERKISARMLKDALEYITLRLQNSKLYAVCAVGHGLLVPTYDLGYSTSAKAFSCRAMHNRNLNSAMSQTSILRTRKTMSY
jgi:hypothetical protein